MNAFGKEVASRTLAGVLAWIILGALSLKIARPPSLNHS